MRTVECDNVGTDFSDEVSCLSITKLSEVKQEISLDLDLGSMDRHGIRKKPMFWSANVTMKTCSIMQEYANRLSERCGS